MSQRLNSYFDASPELRELTSKAERLLALQRLYEQIAPPSMIPHSRVLLLENQTLTLAANNSAIAAKLRQLAPEITLKLQNRGSEITGIRVRVQVTLPDNKLSYSSVKISATGRQRLLQLALEIPDSPLKCALQRLANKA